MKSNLTKVSLALLSAVFILGCQDLGSGPVGPDGLVPQFNKPVPDNEPNRKACEDPGGFIFENGHCHAGEERAELTFDITIDSDQLTHPTTPVTVFGVTTTVRNTFENFPLDLRFFNDHTTCANLELQFGTLFMTRGDADGPHVHVTFRFMHNGSQHKLDMEGLPVDEAVDWGTASIREAKNRPSGFWSMTSKGKNHQNGCKGEDDGLAFTDDDVIYVISVADAA